MSLLGGFDVQDSQGVELGDYQLVFSPGITNFRGNLFGFLIELLYAPLQFIAGVTAWISGLLANPTAVYGGIQDALEDAVSPVFDIIPAPLVAMVAASVALAWVGFTKRSSAQEAFATDGKRALLAVIVAALVTYMASNPFFLVGGVTEFTTAMMREILGSWGPGGSQFLDTFLRPITQMINFGEVLEGSCDAQWSSAVSDGGSLSCVDPDTVKNPGAAQAFAAFLGILGAAVALVLNLLSFALILFHFISALVAAAIVIYAAAFALFRRHNFDGVSRTLGFMGAHVIMVLLNLVISVAGPAVILGIIESLQGETPGAMRLLSSTVLLPVGYAGLIYLMWKLASRTGRLARFLRINSNKTIRKHYGTAGESLVERAGLGGIGKVPEAATEGKLGIAAAWGVGGTGLMEKMMKNRMLSDHNSTEKYTEQDAITETTFPTSYPAPEPELAGGGFLDSDRDQGTLSAVGNSVNGTFAVFNAVGEPVSGWETDAQGDRIPTTFGPDGAPLDPVASDGTVNEVFDAEGTPLKFFGRPETENATALLPGSPAPLIVDPLPAGEANNPFGDQPPAEELMLDEGYVPDRHIGVSDMGEPTTFSTPDVTGAGMHGSTIVPVPPARYTPAVSWRPVGADHPGFAAYPLEQDLTQMRKEYRQQDLEAEMRALDSLSADSSSTEVIMPGESGLTDPGTPSGAFSVGQPEVENVAISRTASLRDPLSGAREAASTIRQQMEQRAAGNSSVVAVDPGAVHMELSLLVENGVPTFRPSHHVNLDGSIA